MSLQIMTENGAKIVAGNVGGGSLPTPTDENKMLISNSSLEWVEIDKADVGISDEYKSKIDSAVQSVKIGNTEYKVGTNVVLPNYPTTLPASDVKAWAKADEKPTYTAEEVGALPDTTVIPTVSNTYSATSEDAMSGLAVASAISDINEMPTPTASDKLLISNSSLEWEEIDKSDISEHYTLPIASANTLGGIKIGSGLNITDDGTVSVNPNSVTIEYITSGTINPATSTGQGVQGETTIINYQFKKTYSSPPRITGHIYPLSAYKDRAIYISEFRNVTTTGCDIVVINPHTSSWSLSERRSIRLVIEDVDGGAGVTSYTTYSTDETLIGKWVDGKPLYQKTIIVESTESGYKSVNLNVNTSYGWIECGFIRYENAYTVSVSPYDDFNYNVPCKALFAIGNNSRIDYRCSSDYVGCKAVFTVRYTKSDTVATI
mgnify:CR=1 FL=1